MKSSFKLWGLMASSLKILSKPIPNYVGTRNSNGQEHGTGEIQFSNGYSFKGNFIDGLRWGTGSYSYKNFDKNNPFTWNCIGKWIKGKPNLETPWEITVWDAKYEKKYFGQIITHKKKSDGKKGKFVSYVISDFSLHGKGELVKTDLKTNKRIGHYNGDFLFNKKNGVGVYINYKDISRYYGEFKDGRRCGKGCVLYQNGTYFHGSWLNGKKSGKGTQYLHDGNMIEGIWNDNNIKVGKVHFSPVSNVNHHLLQISHSYILDVINNRENSIVSPTGGDDKDYFSYKWKFLVDEKKIKNMIRMYVEKSDYQSKFDGESFSRFLIQKHSYFSTVLNFFKEHFEFFYQAQLKEEEIARNVKPQKRLLDSAKDDVFQFIRTLETYILEEFQKVNNSESPPSTTTDNNNNNFRKEIIRIISCIIHEKIHDMFLMLYNHIENQTIKQFNEKVLFPHPPTFQAHVYEKSFYPLYMNRKRRRRRRAENEGGGRPEKTNNIDIPYFESISILKDIEKENTPFKKVLVVEKFRNTLLIEMSKNKKMNMLYEGRYLDEFNDEEMEIIEQEILSHFQNKQEYKRSQKRENRKKMKVSRKKVCQMIVNNHSIYSDDLKGKIRKIIEMSYNFGADDLFPMYFYSLINSPGWIISHLSYIQDWMPEILLRDFNCKTIFPFFQLCSKSILKSFRSKGTILNVNIIEESIERVIVKGKAKKYQFHWIVRFLAMMWKKLHTDDKKKEKEKGEGGRPELKNSKEGYYEEMFFFEKRYKVLVNEIQSISNKAINFFCENTKNLLGIEKLKVCLSQKFGMYLYVRCSRVYDASVYCELATMIESFLTKYYY